MGIYIEETSAFELLPPMPGIDLADLESAEKTALNFMAAQRDALELEIKNSNDALVNARLNALFQSYAAKSRRIQETMAKVTEARIRRLYEGQLRNQSARYHARQKEIEAQRAVTASFSLALRGLVRIEDA